jgi:twitching motility protein PilT
MLANNAVRNLVREGKTHQLKNVMQTGSEQGMQTMERALESLFRSGLISREAALANARDPDTLRSALSAGA